MPFTPFHLGPAVFLGFPMRKYLHAPTFILANVIVDVEPALVLMLGLNYRVHGYLHTFLFAMFTGLLLGYGMWLVERFYRPFFQRIHLEEGDPLKLRSFLFAGVLGTWLHVLLDSPLYTDIRPFYPVSLNPLYAPALNSVIYNLCVWLGIMGLAYYAGSLILITYRNRAKKDDYHLSETTGSLQKEEAA